MNLKIREKCKIIKLVITDVDGVLTDGGLYYTKDGDIMKKFFVRDGMGISLLRKVNIPTIILTKEKTPMVRKWAKNMKVNAIFDGIIEKEKMLDKICNKFGVIPDEIAYIGDDVNDINLLKIVGFSAAPSNAINEVKKICDYVCVTNGGKGVFREIADTILSVKKK